MRFNCEIDQVRTLKRGSKITLAIKDEDTIEVMKHIYNFMDKPITVKLLIDAKEQLERINMITSEQRRKIFAILNDISAHTGENREYLRDNLSQSFVQATEYEEFSLSNCSKQLAADFIEYLLSLAFELGVEFTEDPKEGLEDIDNYLRICIDKRICCICNRPNSDIHHVDAIGMGRDRNKVDDSECRKMCLCRIHHNEYHDMGIDSFAAKYHVYGII